MDLRPDHATAAVLNIDRAIRWYERVLGFELKNRSELANGKMKFADLVREGYGIGLVQGLPTSHPAAAQSAPAWLHIVFSVPDLEAARSELEGKGVQISVQPQSLTIKDSEGNEIELVKR